MTGVTTVYSADAVPPKESVALTACGPGTVFGTVKLPLNIPTASVISGAGTVASGTPSNVKLIRERFAKLMPCITTFEFTSPDIGFREMAGELPEGLDKEKMAVAVSAFESVA